MLRISTRLPFVLTLIIGVTAALNPTMAQDKDGCYSAPGCLEDIDVYWDDDRFVVRWKNTCTERVYAKLCNEYEDGDWDCGEEGLPSGSTATWYTYNASGEYGAIWTGSLNSSEDWVCTGKTDGWYDWP